MNGESGAQPRIAAATRIREVDAILRLRATGGPTRDEKQEDVRVGSSPPVRHSSAGGTELNRRRAFSTVVFLTLGFTIGAADPWARAPWVRATAEIESSTPLDDELTALERRAGAAEIEIRDLADYHATTVAPLIESLHRRTRADSATIERAALALAREGQANGVDPRLLLAVMLVENPWVNPTARSHMGAVGLMQVMPFHAGHWGCGSADLEDPDINICHGTKILARALRVTNGDLDRALLRYNGCVYGTNTPDCHQYPQWVYARAEPAWLSDMNATPPEARVATTGPADGRSGRAQSTWLAKAVSPDGETRMSLGSSIHGKQAYVRRLDTYATAALTGTGGAKHALSSLVTELTGHVADGSLWPLRSSGDVLRLAELETLSPEGAVSWAVEHWLAMAPDSAGLQVHVGDVTLGETPLTAAAAGSTEAPPTSLRRGNAPQVPAKIEEDLNVVTVARVDVPPETPPWELRDTDLPTSRSLTSEAAPDTDLVADATPSWPDPSTPLSTTGIDTHDPQGAAYDLRSHQKDAIPRDAWDAVIGNRILKAL
jgi:soluble lytic murein transglycosylase-like protein